MDYWLATRADHPLLTGVKTYGEASLRLQQDRNEPKRTCAGVYAVTAHV